MLLDDLMPQYRISERHQTTVEGPAEEAFAAFLAIPVGSDRLVRALFRIRGLGGGARTSIADFTRQPPFVVLAQDELELVFGYAKTPEQWRSVRAPGLLIAANVRAIPLADGQAKLTTETRVLPLGRRASVVFRLYWLVVGPFSALIRRRWLRAAAGAVRAAG